MQKFRVSFMKNVLLKLLIGSIFLGLVGCSLEVEHELSKICCGKYLGTTFSGTYHADNGTDLEFSNGLLFTGLALNNRGIAYEYEVNGEYIEFWQIHKWDGEILRDNITGVNGVRRTWYFFDYEPAPEFELNFNKDKSILTGAIERRREVCLPYISSRDLCRKENPTRGLILKKVFSEN